MTLYKSQRIAPGTNSAQFLAAHTAWKKSYPLFTHDNTANHLHFIRKGFNSKHTTAPKVYEPRV